MIPAATACHGQSRFGGYSCAGFRGGDWPDEAVRQGCRREGIQSRIPFFVVSIGNSYIKLGLPVHSTRTQPGDWPRFVQKRTVGIDIHTATHRSGKQGGEPIMEAQRSVDALPISKDVRNFIKAAETLLSPASRTSELTPDECEIIGEYVMSMCHVKQPWSKQLPVKYT